ncbi:MAG: ABC transporter substrate-binding protein [Acidimicrobiales bacterium]|nr:ABC transporter substrate-binding protein [Acidimicrobiales bacterium]
MKKILITLVALLALFATACGGSSDSDSKTSSPIEVTEAESSSSGTNEESSSSSSSTSSAAVQTGDPRDGLIETVLDEMIDNAEFAACLVDAVQASSGLTYEELYDDLVNNDSRGVGEIDEEVASCMPYLSDEEIEILAQPVDEEQTVEPVAADDTLPSVKIGLMNQENDPVGSFPELRLGIEGAAAYINAELGGISGHPVEIVSCVQNSVPAAQECAQDLSTSNLVSVINGINIWTIAFDFYGTMGETPVIGGLPLFAADYNQPNARYFNGGSVAVYSGAARFVAEGLGVKKVAVLVNQNPAALAALEQGLGPIFDDYGVEYEAIDVPIPLTDAIPPMSQAAASDADVIMLLAAGNECVPVIRSANQLGIPPEKMFYSGTCATEDIYAEVGELMVGSWIHKGGYTEQETWAPAEVIAQFAENDGLIEEYAPEAPNAAFTGLGWATMLDIHDLYEQVGVENLSDPVNIISTMDDGETRGRVGSFGWSCVYGDIGLSSLCQGASLFLEIVEPNGVTGPPDIIGPEGYVNGLDLLG